MCRARLSARQPAWSSSGNILLTTALLFALLSLWSDKEYRALPTAVRLTALPPARQQLSLFQWPNSSGFNTTQIPNSRHDCDKFWLFNQNMLFYCVNNFLPFFKTSNLASLTASFLWGAVSSHCSHCKCDDDLSFTVHSWKASQYVSEINKTKLLCYFTTT